MDINKTYSPQRYLGYCWIGIQIPHSVWAASRAPGIPHVPGSCCRPYPLRQRRPAATWLKMVQAATIRICVWTWGTSQRNQGFWWGKWWWFLKQSILKLFTEIEECKESMRPPACFLRGKRMRHLNHLAVSCKEKHETIWCNFQAWNSKGGLWRCWSSQRGHLSHCQYILQSSSAVRSSANWGLIQWESRCGENPKIPKNIWPFLKL